MDVEHCVYGAKVEVDVQGSPSLTVPTVSVDVKQHWTWTVGDVTEACWRSAEEDPKGKPRCWWRHWRVRTQGWRNDVGDSLYYRKFPTGKGGGGWVRRGGGGITNLKQNDCPCSKTRSKHTKKFKRTLIDFDRDTVCTFSGKSPLSSHKTTLHRSCLPTIFQALNKRQKLNQNKIIIFKLWEKKTHFLFHRF